MMTDEHTTGDGFVRWHSDHYTQNIPGAASGYELVAGPIWDTLTDHPKGIALTRIVELLVNDPRIQGGDSWLLSYGTEQRHRKGKQNRRYSAMDPDSPGPGQWTWPVEKRRRYALGERIQWILSRPMIQHKQAKSIGTTGSCIPQTDLLNTINGSRRHEPVYVAGPNPPVVLSPATTKCADCGKQHHTGMVKRPWQYKQGIGQRPEVIRANLHDDIRVALDKDRITNARQLLERVQAIYTK
jgi:hypothetical protein